MKKLIHIFAFLLLIGFADAAQTIKDLTVQGTFTATGSSSVGGITVTGTSGKTLTIDNSLEFAGTDGVKLNLPSNGTLNLGGNTLQLGSNAVLNLAGMTLQGTSSKVVSLYNTLTFQGTDGSTLTLNSNGTLNLNGMTITGTSGKTLAVNNSLTLAGTDGTTLTFPTGGGSVLTTGSTATVTAKSMDGGSNTFTNLPLTSSVTGVLPPDNGGTGTSAYIVPPLLPKCSRLQHAIGSASGPIPILLYGDSMLAYKQGVVADEFSKTIGLSGVGGTYITGSEVLSGSSSIVTDWTVSPQGTYYSIPVSGTVVITQNTSLTSADTVKVMYVAESGDCNFKLESSPDGTTWTTLISNQSTNNSTQIGAVTSATSISTGSGRYKFRVTGVGSGSACKVIGVVAYNHSSTGALLISFAVGGTNASQWATTPTAILNPILTAFAPVATIAESRTTPLSGWVPSSATSIRSHLDTAAGIAMDWLLIGWAPSSSGTTFDNTEVAAERTYAIATAQTSLFEQTPRFVYGLDTSEGYPHLDSESRVASVGQMFQYFGLTSSVYRNVTNTPFRIQASQLSSTSAPQPEIQLQAATASDRIIRSVDENGNSLGYIYWYGVSGGANDNNIAFLPGGYNPLTLTSGSVICNSYIKLNAGLYDSSSSFGTTGDVLTSGGSFTAPLWSHTPTFSSLTLNGDATMTGKFQANGTLDTFQIRQLNVAGSATLAWYDNNGTWRGTVGYNNASCSFEPSAIIINGPSGVPVKIYSGNAKTVTFGTDQSATFTGALTVAGSIGANGGITYGDAQNLVVGTTTGTKIGTSTTQKLGFFNATPIVQPSGDALTALGNLGLVATATLSSADLTAYTGGSSASTGAIGEVIKGSLASGSATSVSNNTPKSITSISLTAGDWEVSGNIEFIPAATTVTSAISGGISTTNNTFGGEDTLFKDAGFTTVSFTAPVGGVTPITQINVSSTTTVYLIGSATFSTSTMTSYGTIRARRIR